MLKRVSLVLICDTNAELNIISSSSKFANPDISTNNGHLTMSILSLLTHLLVFRPFVKYDTQQPCDRSIGARRPYLPYHSKVTFCSNVGTAIQFRQWPGHLVSLYNVVNTRGWYVHFAEPAQQKCVPLCNQWDCKSRCSRFWNWTSFYLTYKQPYC